MYDVLSFFFFQAEDGIRDKLVTGVQTCALPISPGRRRVEVAVGERKGVAAVARHQPQLVPLAAEVGAVDDPFAVGTPVGARLPGRLLVAQLARRGAPSGARRHAPEPARAVDMPAIGHEDDLA